MLKPALVVLIYITHAVVLIYITHAVVLEQVKLTVTLGTVLSYTIVVESTETDSKQVRMAPYRSLPGAVAVEKM